MPEYPLVPACIIFLRDSDNSLYPIPLPAIFKSLLSFIRKLLICCPSGVKIFNVTGNLAASKVPSESLLQYTDITVTNSGQKTQSLPLGAVIGKIEILSYDGTESLETKRKDLFSQNCMQIRGNGTTASKIWLYPAYETDKNGYPVYYGYKVRVYYYSNDYVGCTTVAGGTNTITEINANTFMVGFDIANDVWGFWCTDHGILSLDELYDYLVFTVFRTNGKMYVATTSRAGETLYCYYWK